MRTDAQIASLLLAFTLPIRRYRWYIDPNGARDEVVEDVANDFNLPIEGQDPKPITRRRDRLIHSAFVPRAARDRLRIQLLRAGLSVHDAASRFRLRARFVGCRERSRRSRSLGMEAWSTRRSAHDGRHVRRIHIECEGDDHPRCLLLSVRPGLKPAAPWRVPGTDVDRLWWLVGSS